MSYFTNSSVRRQPQMGDIIGSYLPNYLNKGQPGRDFRLAIVLGVEVDPRRKEIEGLWLCRLSDRVEKVRSWDYVLQGGKIVGQGKPLPATDFVLRTPRIDLIPADAGYFGETPKFYGRVVPSFWKKFLPQLRLGQESYFNEHTYGPREKLPGTVVRSSLKSAQSFYSFDYDILIRQEIKDNNSKPAPARTRPVSIFERDFEKALREQRDQQAVLRFQLHDDFLQANRRDTAWSYKNPSMNRSFRSPS